MTIFLGYALQTIGLPQALLAGPNATGPSLSTGVLLTVISTLAIAAETVLIGLYAGTVDLGCIAVVQLLVGGGLAFLAVPVFGEGVPSFSWICRATSPRSTASRRTRSPAPPTAPSGRTGATSAGRCSSPSRRRPAAVRPPSRRRTATGLLGGRARRSASGVLLG